MKIEQVRVQNYKSILDTKWVDIEDVTTLVGANEAGKTNFLEALSRFKDGEELTEAEISNYRSSSSTKKSEIPIVSLIISSVPNPLFEDVSRIIFKLRDSGLQNKRKRALTRYADGTVRYSLAQLEDNLEQADVQLDHMYTLPKLYKEIEENMYKKSIAFSDEISSVLNQFGGDKSDIPDLIGGINDILSGKSKHFLPEPSPYSKLNTIRAMARGITWSDDVREVAPDELAIIPNFQLFDNIVPISGKGVFDELEKGDPYWELLDAVDLDSESLESATGHEIHDRMDEANDTITQRFDDNWKQANVRFVLRRNDGDVTLRIYEETNDGEREIRTLPSDRSQGFRWFLSFFCHLVAREQGEISNSVILLDDPGAYLHPEGHKNLKKALKQLGEDNQVLYGTHSPYMIDKDNLNSVRTVRQLRDPKPVEDVGRQEPFDEDEERIGTVVTRLNGINDPDHDSLAAVRTALGATFADSLFASKNTVLVEGPDDRTYLKLMSEVLGDDEPLLDNNVNFVVCGGASRADYLARIVESEDYNVAVLLDDDEAGQKAQRKLQDGVEKGELDTAIFHTGTYVDFNADTTIEDLLSPDLLCEVAADVHSEVEESEFQERATPEHGEIAKQLDGRLKQELGNPVGWVLDKAEIARTIDNRAAVEGKELFEQETLDRFEELLVAIDASLDDSEENETDEEVEEVTADD
ncbi:AAA family ATPase [Haladaptatus sp. DYF46]|uniref:ATP-dependent nuclease n=1 Tax=Haladaptatus sp. DYF46 TaxID=2886041 RepID=UPI001E567202|nr:AAA family ATPase [Haladaptatus sp. DYF46]